MKTTEQLASGRSNLKINIGCGQSPTPGWRNFDNSPSVWLARYPLFASLLKALHLIDDAPLRYLAFASENSIEWGDATKGIGLADGSVDVLYASHMVEHLDRAEVVMFLNEAKRLIRPGGFIRLAVPDLAVYIRKYLENGDADALVEATYLTQPKPRTVWQKLKLIAWGSRHHHWMYDGTSLCRLLERSGFGNATVVEPGQTCIPDPGQLDLFERANESLYVEAVRR